MLVVLTLVLDHNSGISVVRTSDAPEKYIIASEDALAFSPCTLNVCVCEHKSGMEVNCQLFVCKLKSFK